MCLCVCSRFLVYSTSSKVLHWSLPHFMGRFIGLIAWMVLVLGSFWKITWQPWLFFDFIFPFKFLVKNSDICAVKPVLRFQPMQISPWMKITETNLAQQRTFSTLPTYLLLPKFSLGRQKRDSDLFEFFSLPPFSRLLPRGDFLYWHHITITNRLVRVHQDHCRKT